MYITKLWLFTRMLAELLLLSRVLRHRAPWAHGHGYSCSPAQSRKSPIQIPFFLHLRVPHIFFKRVNQYEGQKERRFATYILAASSQREL